MRRERSAFASRVGWRNGGSDASSHKGPQGVTGFKVSEDGNLDAANLSKALRDHAKPCINTIVQMQGSTRAL